MILKFQKDIRGRQKGEKGMMPTKVVDYPFIRDRMTRFLRGEIGREAMIVAFVHWQDQNGMHLDHPFKHGASLPPSTQFDSSFGSEKYAY